jgi:hypothetical protein
MLLGGERDMNRRDFLLVSGVSLGATDSPFPDRYAKSYALLMMLLTET